MPGSLSLRLTPERHLVLEATDEEPTVAPEVASRVVAAFSRGTAAGVLHLGAEELDALLPVSLQFWRGVGRVFMAAVCATPDLEAARASLAIPFDSVALVQAMEAAPPMAGGEYLDLPVLDQHDAFNDALTTAMMYLQLTDLRQRGVRIPRQRQTDRPQTTLA